VLVSTVLLIRAWLIGLSFEPTTKALFTEYVVQPQLKAAQSSLVLSVTLLMLLRAARAGRRSTRSGRARTDRVGTVAVAVIAALNALAVGSLTVPSWRASARRAHPDQQMLAALRAVPVDPGWVVQEPAVVHRDAHPIEHVAYPEGRLVLWTGSADRPGVCTNLDGLLRVNGWEPDGYDGCSLSKLVPGVALRASVTAPRSGAPVLVQVDATPTWPHQG